MLSPLPLNLDDVRALTALFQPAVVYLYGSAARGALRPDSDLDLALVPAVPCDPVALYNAAQELAVRCGRDVDFEMYALSDYAYANERRHGALAAFLRPYHAR